MEVVGERILLQLSHLGRAEPAPCFPRLPRSVLANETARTRCQLSYVDCLTTLKDDLHTERAGLVWLRVLQRSVLAPVPARPACLV
ncbi:hypothetical protein KTAU_03240 [Thermogemmatispora aurantia]|uniref:Uncharacterized protein n=1 Tax=Thermogemmatispora aurantia TaxID=2045279 RepID=A0A5J4K6B4_9CHLR|nr:hypothetical protein KTAU_03240 [Thermogemmatispora aurantia]